MKRQEFKGEITVFLSIIFVLLLSLVGALIQSTSIHIGKSRSRTQMQLVLENYFAEYHNKTWEEYSILLREGTDERQMIRRLEFYGAGGGTHKVDKMQLLSDGYGQAFYEQAIRFMGGTVEEDGVSNTWGSTSIPRENVEQEELESKKEMDALLEEEEKDLPEENNPIQTVSNLKKSSLLSLIHPDVAALSTKTIDLKEVPSHRTLNEGNGENSYFDKKGVAERAMFMAYLVAHFEGYSDLYEEGSESAENLSDPQNRQEALDYELEYLLQGEGSDQENLEGVAKKILGIRMAINYAHILSDSEKKAEADAMALGLTALFSVPAAKDIVKHALLLAWAYGESVVDLRVLFKGERVPLVKTKENWQLQLANLSKLGTAEETVTERDGLSGMNYEDYLKGFLAAADLDQVCMRALDVMEMKLDIKVDQCVTMLEIQSTYVFQRGIKDDFTTKYQYH